MAYPSWLLDLLEHGCPFCDRPLRTETIETIGVAGFWSQGEATMPDLDLTVVCRACGDRIRIRAQRDYPDIIEAIRCHCHVLLFDGFLDGIDVPEDEYDPDPEEPVAENDNEFGADSQTIRPSRRDGHPRRPMTDIEVRIFINALRRTSFRRRTKSFERFMRRLGVSL